MNDRRVLGITFLGSSVAAAATMGSPNLVTFGVESALIYGVLLPPVSAAAATLVTGRDHAPGSPFSMRLSRALRFGMTPLIVPMCVQLVALLFVPVCEPLLGLLFFTLGPGLGCLLAAVIGFAANACGLARVTIRGRTVGLGSAAILAALVPFCALIAGFLTFYRSPAIFVFGHFAGWFPGTLYDVGVTIPDAYWSFRATTVVLAAGLLLLLWAGETEDGAISLRTLPAKPARAGFAALLLGLFGLLTGFGETLGHRSSAAGIADRLGKTIASDRCLLHVPRELVREARQLLADDCDFRVAQAERVLGVREPERIVAFFFRSPEEKQALMGARDTFIAKPWRGEVYLQLRPWPHPILAHEIAHVVARNSAPGPLRVGGRAWLPDAGLIEGVAVAVAWETRDDLTPHQWSRALLELDRLPPVASLFGLSFLTLPGGQAYDAAGSFIRYVLDRYGNGAVRRAYRTGDIAGATGKPLQSLEAEWKTFLRAVPLPPEAKALAEIRFSDRGYFSAVCPHKVSKLRDALAQAKASGDASDIASACDAILRVDPGDLAARMEKDLEAASDPSRGRRRGTVTDQIDAQLPAAAAAVVTLRLLDVAWERGNIAEAKAHLHNLAQRPATAATHRALTLRALGLEAGGTEGELIRRLLSGEESSPVGPALAVHIARELSTLRTDGVGSYLEARQLWFAGNFEEALATLARAVALGLPSIYFLNEAKRMQTMLFVATGRWRDARALLRGWQDNALGNGPALSPEDQAFIDDWLARVAWHGRIRREPR